MQEDAHEHNSSRGMQTNLGAGGGTGGGNGARGRRPGVGDDHVEYRAGPAQGGVQVSGTPTLGFSGTGPPGDPYKISGHADFINDDSGPADIRLLGTFSATAGELLVASYELTTTFTPDYDPAYGGDLILRGAVFPDSLPGIGFQLDPGYGVIGLGTEQHQGGGSFEIPFDMPSASFVIELHMYLGQQGTLSVDIPSHSIDFALVPEPGTLMLVALAWCSAAGFLRTARKAT